MGWELEDVEKPFVEQLQALGWVYIAGSLDDPSVTGRSSFSEVIQECVLREQLRALNPGPDGSSWLDDERLSSAVHAITRLGTHKLMEANERATELLLKGVTVDGLPGWDGGRGQTIRFIDWETPANNRFTVVNQYRVDCPPGYDSAKGFIVPDLVLLVNGVPLVVVECKSPSLPNALPEAVDQLRRYSNQRKAAHEVTENEGNEALFATAQLLVATSYDHARVGCIGAEFQHFTRWKTLVNPDGTGGEQDREPLLEQQRLVAGMLPPTHLLDLVRHFVIFMQAGGRTIKSVCRYQQYRAVNLAIRRLKTGQTRLQHGEHDQRGGIIWHTQGSGKSLTMVFLVRKMRADVQLRRYKVIVVTDRKDLQTQLSATAALTGENVEVARHSEELKEKARRQGPGLIFATIQKYRDKETDEEAEDHPKPYGGAPYGVLNEDDGILVLVDEAHRTQAGDLHANLLAALPNCARIGFTGTPIIMGEKKRTHEIFGSFIDRYTIKEAEADGATVPVLYEGLTADGAVKDGASMDGLFEDLFCDRTEEETEAIKRKYATKGNVVEAPALIKAKAADMIRHYVTHLLPNGYKAQVVAASRLAATRYFEALTKARDELLAAAGRLSPEDQQMDDEALCLRSPRMQAEVQAWRYREALASIEFAVIISGSTNDAPEWTQWTDGARQEALVKRFKRPLKEDPLAFLVVKSMLLTGFDAPIEGVMYLDRSIREAELLQAIARVNRTGFGKRVGLVVDYYGVAKHLKEALAAYSDEDVDGALASLKDEVPILRDRHLRVVDLFRQRGVESLDDTEACIDVLGDEKTRAEFTVKLKAFADSLDTVLPRPEGLPYSKDAKRLAYIYARARNRYKDTPMLGKDVGAKVRKLIDDHVISLGIDPKIPPIQLTDANFAQHVGRQANDRAKASEMEHAIRSHIRKHMDEDPVRYKNLSERLKEILHTMGEQWSEIVEQLHLFIEENLRGSGADADTPKDLPEHYAPFLRTVTDVICRDKAPTEELKAKLTVITVAVVDLIIATLKSDPKIWEGRKKAAQDDLNGAVFTYLMSVRPPLVSDVVAGEVADKLLDQARATHEKLIKL